MIIETFHYGPLTASSVRFDPGERHFIEGSDGKCVGVLFVSGSWRLHSSGLESGADDLGWHVPNPDRTWPRQFWNSYDDKDYCEGGPNGVSWACLELNETGSREVSYQDSPATLPAGYGLIVGSGSVIVGKAMDPAPVQTPTMEIIRENKTFRIYKTPIKILGDGRGEALNYFRPADADREVQGTAQLLLVK